MKLRTKFEDDDFDLDEVVEAIVYNGGHGRIKLIAEAARGGEHTFYFESLKDLNDLFEDYEEPKEYWCIDWTGGINHITVLDDVDKYEENKKEIGNYFETEEEAERVVEKLKAWKRLKDKGFRFLDHIDRDCGQGITRYEWNGYIDGEDLDLLFGGDDE